METPQKCQDNFQKWYIVTWLTIAPRRLPRPHCAAHCTKEKKSKQPWHNQQPMKQKKPAGQQWKGKGIQIWWNPQAVAKHSTYWLSFNCFGENNGQNLYWLSKPLAISVPWSSPAPQSLLQRRANVTERVTVPHVLDALPSSLSPCTKPPLVPSTSCQPACHHHHHGPQHAPGANQSPSSSGRSGWTSTFPL